MAGSFIGVVAERWPAGRPFLLARSECDACHATLRWWELVPLASFVALRGRCARCGAGIGWRHPTVELAAAGIGAAAFAIQPAGALLGWALLALALIDARHFWLPDRLTLPLLALGLALGAPPLPDRAVGAVAGWTSLRLIAWTYERARGRVGLGAGDAKLFAAIGAWLGWRDLPLVLLAASLAGLAWALAASLAGRPVTATTRLPLGTLLALAAFPVWLLRSELP